MGRRNNPLFRVVVTEGSRGPKSEKAVEILGSYDPHQNVKTIDAERASYWISKGVQPSGTVHNLLVDLGVVKTKKVNVLPQKSPVKNPDVAKDSSGEESTSDGAREVAEEKAEAPAEEASTENETGAEKEPDVEGESPKPKEEGPEETASEEKPAE